jgi:virginiamycin B lyase
MAGQVSVFPIPGALDTGLIATDFEGSLWFFGAFNEIVRRAADGTLSVFTVPTPSPALGGLCRGPDGKMWFTVSVNGYKIDNITSAGLITEFDAHTTTNMPSMALGADDALWFTQTYSSDGIGRVGRVTTAGSVTQYPVPGKPFGITSGPDGALWYTDAEGAIGRLSVSGMATRIVTLRPSSDPQGITVGPDGAIWFTEREGFIGRLGVTVAGTVEIPGVSDAGLAATAVILAIGGATFLRRS